MCGMTAGWRGQTCPRGTEAGRPWTLLPRRPVRAPSAAAPPPSAPSARAKSSSNTTRRLSLRRWGRSPGATPPKESLLGLTLFFSNQVNSDKIYWQRNLDGTFSQIFSERKAVGHFISTKAVGSDERADITHLYKHQEGKQSPQVRAFCCPPTLPGTMTSRVMRRAGERALIRSLAIRFRRGTHRRGDRQSLRQ